MGPEHGTVGQELIKEAAKEALRGVGFDLLVVCGFAFDASANEAANQFNPEGKKASDKIVAEGQKQYGKLPVLLARMNPDLAMGEELLKKTGAGNLFMVFGEPDLKVKKVKDNKITVEIKGVDVYDPTTGQIRSSSQTTSPAGSSTRTTTEKASSFATPTSPAQTSPMTSSNAPFASKSTRPPGQCCTRP